MSVDRKLGPMMEEVDWGDDSPHGGASSASGPDRGTVRLVPCEGREDPPRAKVPRGEDIPKGTAEGTDSFVPLRVQKVLDEAKDFKTFKEGRIFKYLHLFSGPQDNLAEALKDECKTAGLEVEVKSVDKDTSRWSDLDKEVNDGGFDGSHAGFPCGSFSMLRWRASPGMPLPVRSSEFPYGLPSNSESQQREADQGTLFASWSIRLLAGPERVNEEKEGTRSMYR